MVTESEEWSPEGRGREAECTRETSGMLGMFYILIWVLNIYL